jgi:hypothetical protein
LREGNGVTWNVGDTFDRSTIFNSTGNDAAIMDIFNGVNADLAYLGGDFASFSSATINVDSSGFYEGVAFAFNSASGNITFNGVSTFNGGQTRGAADFIVVPVRDVAEPSALLLLMGGLFGLMFRKKITKN